MALSPALRLKLNERAARSLDVQTVQISRYLAHGEGGDLKSDARHYFRLAPFFCLETDLRQELSDSIRKLMSQAIEEGYVTYDALNAAVPSDDYTSEEIEDVVALLSSKGIAIVDTQPEEATPLKGVATYEYRPGMKFYEAVWKRDGEEIFRLHTHAADEAEAIAIGHACFAGRPELCMGHNLEGTTVEVGYGSTSPKPYDPGVTQASEVTCWQEKDQKRLEDVFAALSQKPQPPR